MKGFIQNARLLAGGHMTKSPPFIMYAGVVSMETVGIALMIFIINDLESKYHNNLNTFIQVPVTKKV